MNRSVVLSSVAGSLLLLSACSGHDGLSVRGTVTVTNGADLSTGLSFAQDTRLDEMEATAAMRVTGTCEMRRTVDADGMRQWTVLATIDGAEQPGLGLSSITMTQTTGGLGEGHIDAQLGQTPYSSAAGCVLDVPYVLGDNDGMTALQGQCTIADADGNSATAAVDLEWVGCTVADGS